MLDLTIHKVPLSKIDFKPEENVRSQVLTSAAQTANNELADSIKSIGGLIQPVGLTKQKDGKHKVVWGFRRTGTYFALAESDKRFSEITAYVVPPGTTEAQVEELRATENLIRHNLTPIEEMSQVNAILKHKGYNFARVAKGIGKSEAWVRDRFYLSRLPDAIAAKVHDGSIPLGHALELCKIGDPQTQADLAAIFCNGETVAPLHMLKSEVAKRRYSLAVIPWDEKDKFANTAGTNGACKSCRFNSMNTDGLVDEANAVCLNAKCFEAKRAATEVEVAKAATNGTAVANFVKSSKTAKVEIVAKTEQANAVSDEAKWYDDANQKILAAVQKKKGGEIGLFLCLKYATAPAAYDCIFKGTALMTEAEFKLQSYDLRINDRAKLESLLAFLKIKLPFPTNESVKAAMAGK